MKEKRIGAEQDNPSIDEECCESESSRRKSIREFEERNGNGKIGRSICGAHQEVFIVIAFALTGFATGFGMSLWEPKDEQTKTTVLQWIGLLGAMFVRALKALVLPLVFVNVWLAVVDLASHGLGGKVTRAVFFFFALTTVMASIAGLLPFLFTKHLIEELDGSEGESLVDGRHVMLGCSNDEGSYLAVSTDGSIVCATNWLGNVTHFILEEPGGVEGTEEHAGSISQTIYDGIFVRLIPETVFAAWVEGNYAAVVVMAICFGVSLISVLAKRRCDPDKCVLVILLRDTYDMVQTLTRWVLKATPLAVFSLNVHAVGSQDDIIGTMTSVGWLIFAFALAAMIHSVVGFAGLYFVTTKSNPFPLAIHLIPAISTAFATSSSAAALPLNLECVRNSGKVPECINRFVLPLGLTINMDGTALYASCGSLWLAYVNGIEPSVGQVLLLILLSSVGSVGAAPVPYGPLVVVLNTFATVFGVGPTTQGQEFLFALDWLLDGTGSALSATGDAVVAYIVASSCAVLDDEEENYDSQRTLATGSDEGCEV